MINQVRLFLLGQNMYVPFGEKQGSCQIKCDLDGSGQVCEAQVGRVGGIPYSLIQIDLSDQDDVAAYVLSILGQKVGGRLGNQKMCSYLFENAGVVKARLKFVHQFGVNRLCIVGEVPFGDSIDFPKAFHLTHEHFDVQLTVAHCGRISYLTKISAKVLRFMKRTREPTGRVLPGVKSHPNLPPGKALLLRWRMIVSLSNDLEVWWRERVQFFASNEEVPWIMCQPNAQVSETFEFFGTEKMNQGSEQLLQC